MNNTPSTVSSSLYGTKTAENLRNAFTKEAEALAKSLILAEIADDEGENSAKRVLKEHADNDMRHAELWLGYLDELSDAVEDLSELASMKNVLGSDLYPLMAEIADDEGFEEIAEKMRLVAAVKAAQSNTLKSESDRIANADTMYSDNPETEWHCHSCGYNITGNMPPERCPLCSYPASYFARN